MSGYTWKLEVRPKGYNPDQPRVPAGSSRGGQWTAGTHADFVQLQRDVRGNFPQPVRDVIAAGVREHYADRDISEHQVDMYLDVMAMDKEKFTHYGEKLGLKDLDALWEQYSSEAKAVDDTVRRKVLEMKDALAFKVRDKAVQDSQGKKWDRYYGNVGNTATEARLRLRDGYGVEVMDQAGVGMARIHKDVSFLLNLAEQSPAIATILKERVRELKYEQRRPGNTAIASWAGSSNSIIVPIGNTLDDWPMSPSILVHELGHAADAYLGGGSALSKLGFGQGRAASLYGTTNSDEDWAEWFTTAFAETPGARGWDRGKYDRARSLIEQLGGIG